MPGVWGTDDIHSHLVARECADVVQRTQVCHGIDWVPHLPTDTCRVNIEHQMLGRGEAAIDGVPHDGEESSSGSSTRDDDRLEMDKAGKMA